MSPRPGHGAVSLSYSIIEFTISFISIKFASNACLAYIIYVNSQEKNQTHSACCRDKDTISCIYAAIEYVAQRGQWYAWRRKQAASEVKFL